MLQQRQQPELNGLIRLDVGAAVLLLLGIGVANSLHRVEEGHLGMYWVGGALLNETTAPGYHWKNPLLTSFANVQITLQTDVVKEIPCGTSGGVMVTFGKIEVVNILDARKAHQTIKLYGVDYDRTWIFDRIHHEINQFCSSHTLQQVYIDMFDALDEALSEALQKSCDEWDTGIKIIGIRVTKPIIPQAIRESYEAIQKQKTQQLLQTEQEKTVRKEEEIKRTRETIQAEKEADVARITATKEATVARLNAEKNMQVARLEAEKNAEVARLTSEKELLQKEAERAKQQIEDAIHLARQRAMTDAAHYDVIQRAHANSHLYTEQYLRYIHYTSLATALANNTKIYFGDKIPTALIAGLSLLPEK